MIDSLNAVLLIKILQRHQASILAGTTVVAIHAVNESDVVEMVVHCQLQPYVVYIL